MAVARRRADARVGEGLPGGHQRKPMRTRSELEQPWFADGLWGSEVLDLGADADGEAACIELPDRSNTTAAREQAGPRGGRVAANGRHHTHAGNGNPSPRVHIISPPLSTRPEVAISSLFVRASRARLADSFERCFNLASNCKAAPGGMKERSFISRTVPVTHRLLEGGAISRARVAPS